jgi:membrane-associated protease RseP (regulator of RpoE activity)
MNALWYYAIGFVVIWLVGIVLSRKYKNITIEGLVLMVKTERLRDTIDKIANKCPRFWKWSMNIGIPLGVFFMILMAVSLVISLKMMFDTPTVALILPGVDIPGSPLYIPFLTGLIALATVIIIHEFGHGIVARTENISIKSIGLLLFAIIPGAFVEPDEDEVKQLNGLAKIRIYSAGALFNIALCIVAILLATGIGMFIGSAGMYTTDGMELSSVVPGSPSDGVLQQGMVITGINNQPVTGYTSYVKAFNNTHIGDTVSVTTQSGVYNIKAASSPNNSSKAYIGIRAQEHVIVTSHAEKTYGTLIPWILTQLRELCYWIFLLNFAVGTFNLLPMKPLDGGLIFEEMLKCKIKPDRRKDFNNTLNAITKYLPIKVRCWISRRFNTFLNFLSRHSLNDKTVEKSVSLMSYVFGAILIVLIIYGTVPGIIKML